MQKSVSSTFTKTSVFKHETKHDLSENFKGRGNGATITKVDTNLTLK